MRPILLATSVAVACCATVTAQAQSVEDLQRQIDELKAQIIDLAVDRAFLADPLPTDEAAFKRRIDEGRTRLTLIAQEVARLAAQILADSAVAARKLKDSRPPKEVADDVQAQLQQIGRAHV